MPCPFCDDTGWNPIEHIDGNAYLIAALALSVWAAVMRKGS